MLFLQKAAPEVEHRQVKIGGLHLMLLLMDLQITMAICRDPVVLMVMVVVTVIQLRMVRRTLAAGARQTGCHLLPLHLVHPCINIKLHNCYIGIKTNHVLLVGCSSSYCDGPILSIFLCDMEAAGKHDISSTGLLF